METKLPLCDWTTLEGLLPILAVGCAFILFTGCASTPKNEGANGSISMEEILNQKDVAGKAPTVFQQPLERTRVAAIRALTFVGCEIKQQQPYYVSGRRPNKVGLFVGSGGETVEVFLYPRTENETHVWVDTDLSFVGMAGQQGWDKQVIDEMTSILSTQPKSQ